MEKLFLLHRWRNSLQKLEANNSVIFIMTIYSECQYDIDRFFTPLAKLFEGKLCATVSTNFTIEGKNQCPKISIFIDQNYERTEAKYYEEFIAAESV